MTWLIFLLVGLAVGYWLGKRMAEMAANPRREKVVGLFNEQSDITNDDVQRVLGVSDATATRVLDVLEKSGDIVQIGKTGAGVVYRRR
jgi:predicted HTH transcriptional regulator